MSKEIQIVFTVLAMFVVAETAIMKERSLLRKLLRQLG